MANEITADAWRVGTHYNIHVYDRDRPVATFFDCADAAEAVAAVNAARRACVALDVPAPTPAEGCGCTMGTDIPDHSGPCTDSPAPTQRDDVPPHRPDCPCVMCGADKLAAAEDEDLPEDDPRHLMTGLPEQDALIRCPVCSRPISLCEGIHDDDVPVETAGHEFKPSVMTKDWCVARPGVDSSWPECGLPSDHKFHRPAAHVLPDARVCCKTEIRTDEQRSAWTTYWNQTGRCLTCDQPVARNGRRIVSAATAAPAPAPTAGAATGPISRSGG